MNIDMPNTTAAGDIAGTPAGSSKGLIICPDPFIEAENEIIGALEYGLYGMITGRAGIVREAMDKLSVAIEEEKREEAREKRKEEREMRKEEREKEKEREREARRKREKERERKRERKKEMERQRQMEAEMEMEMEKEKSRNATTTPNTRWLMAAVLIPPPPAASYTYLDCTNISENSTTNKIRKKTQPGTFDEVRQGQRRSMRIIESRKKSAQGEGGPDAPVLGGRANTPKKGLMSQIVEEASTKAKSPVLKPRTGAGVVKKTVVGGLRGRIAAKAKAGMGEEPRAGAGVVKKTALRGLRGRIAAKAKAGMGEEVKNQTITPATTTDKVTKAPRARVPREVSQGSRRRGVRTTESGKKSVQGEAGSAAPAPVQRGKAPGDGLGGQDQEASTKAKSPILKPKAGAGVPKRRGRGGACGRIGKARGVLV
ncbi:hypothetical protein C7212DRAFT_346159 [Tuber magnatum]|uniref:Uncharacterized protein n=1 Tax=Tuber magnatum TaxID=42249 RepID=A0A317SIB1_9PEZI|nr:hypothetical protein C7212DRAFT_346159 [Tuber magnatum]